MALGDTVVSGRRIFGQELWGLFLREMDHDMLLFCFPSTFRAGKGDCRKTRAGEDLERLREEQTKTPTWAGPGASRYGEFSGRFREETKKRAEDYGKFGARRGASRAGGEDSGRAYDKLNCGKHKRREFCRPPRPGTQADWRAGLGKSAKRLRDFVRVARRVVIEDLRKPSYKGQAQTTERVQKLGGPEHARAGKTGNITAKLPENRGNSTGRLRARIVRLGQGKLGKILTTENLREELEETTGRRFYRETLPCKGVSRPATPPLE